MPAFSKPRDALRQRSYEWERDVVLPRAPQDLDRVQLESEVRSAWFAAVSLFESHFEATTSLRDQVPPVLYSSRMSGALASYWHYLTFGPGTYTRAIAIHEVAHLIEFHDCLRTLGSKRARPGHGPHWLGWYIALLDHFLIVPRNTLLRSAKFYRLPIVPKTVSIATTMAAMKIKPAEAP